MIATRLSIVLSEGRLAISKLDATALSPWTVTRGNTITPFEVELLAPTGNTAAPFTTLALPSGFTGIKVLAKARPSDTTFLFEQDTFAATGSGETLRYAGTLDLNTVELNAKFPSTNTVLQWLGVHVDVLLTRDNGTFQSVITNWPCQVLRGNTTGDEGAVTATPSPEDYVTERAVRFDIPQTLDSDEQLQARTNIAAPSAAALTAEAAARTAADTANAAAITAEAATRATAITSEVTNRNTAIADAINALVAGAPGALDTLKELADKLADDDDALAALTTAIAAKASQAALNTLASVVAAKADTTDVAALALVVSGKSQIIRASGVLRGDTDAGSDEVPAGPAESYINSDAVTPAGATYQGAWDSGTSYTVGDFVYDSGHLWLAFATPSGTGTAPASDPASWENRDSTVQVRLTLDGVTGSLLTITTAATGGTISLNLAGNESQATVIAALSALLAPQFVGLGIVLTEGSPNLAIATPGTGSTQLVAITSATGIFASSGGTNAGVDYVAAVAASGAINEVELIAAAGAKKAKTFSAWMTGTLPVGEVKLSVKHDGDYTDITIAVTPDGAMHAMPPDDNGGGATPSVFLAGLNAGESLIARRTHTTGMQAGATCRIEVLAEQSA